MKLTNEKKGVASFIPYQYKREVYLKEHDKQNALCLAYYQKRVDKNAMLKQIAPSTN